MGRHVDARVAELLLNEADVVGLGQEHGRIRVAATVN